ncbi:hypothetical protein BDV95DRAFT_51759 [Massariosphaeria phaeospora]|uniref:Uncharacterized protein n=1 Tax=Massariosphaeria phaeospora TaxID=100035 RepID=A0A7C8M5E1_9PLEO|nr:hypothetical protein BDV95DRAFT_51759 [Massariosphaeria phaeospora]
MATSTSISRSISTSNLPPRQPTQDETRRPHTLTAFAQQRFTSSAQLSSPKLHIRIHNIRNHIGIPKQQPLRPLLIRSAKSPMASMHCPDWNRNSSLALACCHCSFVLSYAIHSRYSCISLFLYLSISLFLYSSIPLFLCSSVPLFLCSSVPLLPLSPPHPIHPSSTQTKS